MSEIDVKRTNRVRWAAQKDFCCELTKFQVSFWGICSKSLLVSLCRPVFFSDLNSL